MSDGQRRSGEPSALRCDRCGAAGTGARTVAESLQLLGEMNELLEQIRQEHAREISGMRAGHAQSIEAAMQKNDSGNLQVIESLRSELKSSQLQLNALNEHLEK